MSRRLSLRGLIALVAVLGLAFAVIQWNDPAARYRRAHGADDLFAALKGRIRNGDSVARLKGLLSPAGRVSIRGYRDVVESDARRNPKSYGEGVGEGDEFLSYGAGGLNIVLQARNGRLVNFNPADYPFQLNVLGR